MAQHWGKEEVIAFLRDGGYEFKMVEHEAVFTMELSLIHISEPTRP